MREDRTAHGLGSYTLTPKYGFGIGPTVHVSQRVRQLADSSYRGHRPTYADIRHMMAPWAIGRPKRRSPRSVTG